MSGFAQVTVSAPTIGGGTSVAVSFNIIAITPVIASISPSSTTAGSAPVTLTVEGSNFDYRSQRSGGMAVIGLPTLSAVHNSPPTLSSADVATVSVAQVTVRMPLRSGGGLPMRQRSRSCRPCRARCRQSLHCHLSSLTAGVTGLAVAVTGTGFVGGSIAQWNGANRVTTVKSSTLLFVAPLPGRHCRDRNRLDNRHQSRARRRHVWLPGRLNVSAPRRSRRCHGSPQRGG